MKNKKRGISLIVLVITIIVIIILAAAVILTLTDNNPISNAKKAAFANDLSAFKDELDMYKTNEYTKKAGDYAQSTLNADEDSLVYEGQLDNAEEKAKTIYTAIPSLKDKSKYAGQFIVLNGVLVYQGNDSNIETWAGELGVTHELPGAPKINIIPPATEIVSPGTDLVYALRVLPTVNITTSNISSKIQVIDNNGSVVNIPNEDITISEVSQTSEYKQVSVTLKTNNLVQGLYKLKINIGAVTNQNNLESEVTLSINSFEIVDTVPPTPPTYITNPATGYTSGNVTVDIIYSADSIVKEYSLDNVNWNTYLNNITVNTNNTTIYARAKDASNNYSNSSITISNIDRVSPTVIFGTNGGSNATQVSTTVTLSDISGINISSLQYVWDTQNTTTPVSGWTTFTNGATITKSGTGIYYLWIKGTDNCSNNIITKSNVFGVGNVEIPVSVIQTENKTFAGATTGFTYNNPVIPAGFAAVNTTDANWNNLSTDWDKGLVIQDISSNQFVWIPVDGTNVKYLKNFTYPSWYGATISNTPDDNAPSGIDNQITQITKYQGFYIARYEAAKDGSNNLVSKKGFVGIKSINYPTAKATSESMYSTAYVKSGILTGTQFDTVLNWISNSGKNVNNSIAWGNYSNSISPANVSGYGTTQVTGYSEYWKAKNIYDFAGNLWEIVGEKSPSGYVMRAGNSSNQNGTQYPVSYRCDISSSYTFTLLGFRVALFVI